MRNEFIKRVRGGVRRVLIAVCACLLVQGVQGQVNTGEREKGTVYWGVLGGGGMSIPGWGSTKERVKTVDLLLQNNRVLLQGVGQGWYRGDHELHIELPVMAIVDPAETPIFSMNFLAVWRFTASPVFQPYVQAGGGPVYVEADIPGVGSSLCGNYQFGVGIRYPLRHGWALNAEARYHHISNLGFAEPNVPLNSVKVLVGVTFDL